MIMCTFENNAKANLKHVSVDVLLLQQNKILLERRAKHLHAADLWSLVGGFVDANETLKEAAKREVLEETGYTATLEALFKITDDLHRPHDDRKNITFTFIGKALQKVGEPDGESSEIQWCELQKLPQPEEFAFDHYKVIQLYIKYLETPFPLPVF